MVLNSGSLFKQIGQLGVQTQRNVMIDGYGSGQGAGELGVIEDSQVSLGGEDVNAAS